MFQACRPSSSISVFRKTALLHKRPPTGNNLPAPFWQRKNNSTSFHNSAPPRRIVVGVTGATGAVYAARVLTILRDLGIETHLVMSKWATATLKYETTTSASDICKLASEVHSFKDVAAPIASGSFLHDGMIIVPCSMKTLGSIRAGICDDLVSRAADVSLKEGRRLMLVVRETPLSQIHLSNMLFLRQAGAIIFPPVPAFYNKPQSLEDMVDQSAGRMLDCRGINTDGFQKLDNVTQPSGHKIK
ncbi:hypothetical protein INS49_008117 [Diaporthe citri]|uniref:uncharacterized protein n=1 Tax=Diaporthe citri TaxID=83186 RepID=UPI001C81A023|nr:uncharacterized protein INS49_008117 [Diaporthe citri]KAG6363022.1 hypothetical protein INS49_008117 [Diaporthe citri]